MRISLPAATLSTFLIALSLGGAEPKRTDARNYGLIGPIHSVSTQEGQPLFNIDQRSFPVLIGHTGCQECEFDRWGALVKSGSKFDGEFRGETFRSTRDEAGDVVEQARMDSRGRMVGLDVFGPYGVTEHDEFQEDKRSFHTVWTYDSNGHMREFVQYDGDDQIISRTVRQSDSSGNIKEEWSYGKDEEFSYHIVDTYDPKTDIWTWTSFDENGHLKVGIATQEGKVLFYRHPTTQENAFGEHFFLDRIGKTQHTFRGHSDGTFDDVTTIYPDETNHLARRLEWRDGNEVLRLAADFEYETDAHGNWTRRNTWVWTPELGERKLYETDTRTLTYWY